jgi:predicted transcriptional regulator
MVRAEYRDPGFYLNAVLGGVFALIVRDFAPMPERLVPVLGRLREVPRVLDEGKANLDPAEAPRLWAQMAVESAQMGVALFLGLIPSLAAQVPDIADELVAAAQTAGSAVQAYAAWVETEVVPNAWGEFPAGRELFDTMLRENHMVDWDAEWLLVKGHELYDSTLAEMEALSREIDPEKSAKELVEEIKDNHPSAGALLDVYREAMEEAREFVIERDLVTIPVDESLKIIETPMFVRNQIPYAAYMPPGLLEKVQQGVFMVTPVDPNEPPEKQEEKLRGHGYDDLAVTALHEAYPGHHLQLVVANLNPSLPRLFGGFLSSLFVEGWAFYCEEMMEQQGFISKPIQRLGRLQAQLWRAARIIVDVSLHAGKMGYEEAIEFMVEKANLEPSDARAEVNRYTQSPTQPMSYLMGKYEIMQIVAEYQARHPGHSLKQMHDAMLSGGSLPPRLLRRHLFERETQTRKERTAMTPKGRWYLDVAGQAFSGMGASTDAAVSSFMEDRGLEGPDLYFLQGAHGFAPNAVTPEHFTKRGPYGNPKAAHEQLEKMVSRGWLEVASRGQYALTDQGEELAKEIFSFAGDLYGSLEPLPDDDLERITALLDKVVESARSVPEFEEKWGLSWGALFDRGPSAPAAVRLRRRMLDLFAFRDDAHIAAWKPYGVKGYVWETLTYVWQGDAGTAAELAEKLPYRNLDEETYAGALKELVAKGWIAEDEGKHVITKEGKALRQEAEDATDRYFDAAWVVLSDEEMGELKGLLEKLAEALRPPEDAD